MHRTGAGSPSSRTKSSNADSSSTSSSLPTIIRRPKTTVPRGWPVWMKLAVVSFFFYLFLVLWFYQELSGMLSKHDNQSELTKATAARHAKAEANIAALNMAESTKKPIIEVSEDSISKGKDDDEDEEKEEELTPPPPKEQPEPEMVEHHVVTEETLQAETPKPSTTVKIAATETKDAATETKGTANTVNDTTDTVETSDTTTFYGFNRNAAEAHLLKHGPTKLRKIIGAYLEPAVEYTVNGTINQGAVDQDEDPGIPPQFIAPIPLRTFTPDDLKHYQYPNFQTCHDLPAKLPIDRGLEIDPVTGEAIVWNVGNVETPDDYPQAEAPYCPVDADPFLPWIHDVFPNGNVLEFIAHNRRRCKTGRKHRKDVLRLEPQVALMQHVSVARVESNEKAKEMAPELWDDTELEEGASRYRLAALDEAAEDGQETRFICRFYGTKIGAGEEEPQSVLIDEVLSVYPYNYEFVSYRKGKNTMLSPKGKDNKYFWTSVLRFQCPIPKQLQAVIASGESIMSDGTPTLHVDLIPIRTPPRFGVEEVHLPERMIGPRDTWWKAENWHNWRPNGAAGTPVKGFDATNRWGAKAVLPRVEASGRWTNLPICHPSSLPKDETGDEAKTIVSPAVIEPETERNKGEKPHLLSACIWASASFKTRGKGSNPILDTGTRLQEWIEFHLMVGFDHIYVFDNSGAQTNETSLEGILDLYPKSQITRIEWPSIICNNNIPAHDSTGERSSQYTAENACRTRAAPFTEWIAAFDTDEYLIPAGDNASLRPVLRAAQKKGTNILTFRSSRARLLYDRSQDNEGGNYRVKLPNETFMGAYNCDSSPIPKPEWADRARKQIYRADYVPYHYVHYSTVTKGIMRTYEDLKEGQWKRMYSDRTERVTDEANEAIMLHTKTTTPEQTSRWEKRCHYQFDKKWRGCYVGFVWPNGTEDLENNHNADGMMYNCFQNDRLETYWIPKLKEALTKRHALLSSLVSLGD